MNTETLQSRLTDIDEFGELLKALSEEKPVQVGGLSGGSTGFLISTLFRNDSLPFLVLTPGEREASELFDELNSLYNLPVHHIPTWETTEDEADLSLRPYSNSNRLETLLHLQGIRTERGIWICSLLSLMQGIPETDELSQSKHTIEPGDKENREHWVQTLVDHGYERTHRVVVPGEFAVRGGVLDLYPEGVEHPLRIEFFDNRIESIRTFDPGKQSSMKRLESCSFLLVDRSQISEQTGIKPGPLLLDFFRDSPRFLWLDPGSIYRRADRIKKRHEGNQAHERFTEITLTPEAKHRLEFSQLPPDDEGGIAFSTGTLVPLGENREEILERIQSVSEEASTVYIVCQTEGEQQRLEEILEEANLKLDARIHFTIGELTKGFLWPSLDLAMVSREHLRESSTRMEEMSYEKGAGTRPIDDFVELKPGDYVVHVDYGIARFGGLTTSTRDGTDHDVMKLFFKNSVELEVPETQFHRVQKYLGSGSGNPPQSKLTGDRWDRKKEKVGEAVRELGREMIEIQAVRARGIGHACKPDTEWQEEFEAAFPHNETPDQERVSRKIKQKMESSQPMDLLLTGDVGFGKTELAMRAAFKMVMEGKQVAMLSPTTVLTQQHLMTFRERMGPYPINIESLSRFKSGSEQRETLEKLESGNVDIVVGTHRLLSNDVKFNDLGLVIIDEEQRFGVKHKEHLKRLRTTVDVLTLTATPIPRSLHMALLGIRDIATLRTPPGGRREIKTKVMNYEKDAIRKALVRELDRDGQVYYLHNRVKTIKKVRDRIRDLVPEATVRIGHGQMKEGELQKVMMDFYKQKIDILVCTTIIESGVDHKNVNTMIVEHADRFGLSDLHQLRGRIGRHHRQAYAYFVVPKHRTPTPAGRQRLEAIQEYSELGSGFKVALRDLEIRGAGRLLGSEQSGHIDRVGYDLYCKLLRREIKRLKGEELPPDINPSIQLPVDLRLPSNFASSKKERIKLYQRFGTCESRNEIDNLQEELKDFYGQDLPQQVKNLATFSKLRLLASKLRITSIKAGDRLLIMRCQEPENLQPLLRNFSDLVHQDGEHKFYIYIDPEEAEELNLITTLVNMLSGSADMNLDHERTKPASVPAVKSR